MKTIFSFLLLLLTSATAFSNVNYIDISKISSDSKLVDAFKYIKENSKYYDHWTNDWRYDKSKDDLIKRLRDYYKAFGAIQSKNGETHLLLGDIAHYLYNMDDTSFFSVAESEYKLAMSSDPKDYRAPWFLGYHYSLSDVPISAIENLMKAETLLPANQPADFWNDFAFATGIANMPSYCIYAMDKVKSITGKEGSFQQQLGPTIYKRIVPVDKNKSYDKNDLWSASDGEKTTFTSRPLGIKLLVDSTWNMSVYDYEKNQCAFIINPPTLKNKNGREIHYTVAILMRTANEKDVLDDYVNNLVSKFQDKKKISFSDKYDKIIAYEIKEKTMYPEVGGGHMYMIGIERSDPKYPGLLLEKPATTPKGDSEGLHFYRAVESKDRFKGKIFYAIMLDTCEDIHDQCYLIFKSLFDNQIVIE